MSSCSNAEPAYRALMGLTCLRAAKTGMRPLKQVELCLHYFGTDGWLLSHVQV